MISGDAYPTKKCKILFVRHYIVTKNLLQGNTINLELLFFFGTYHEFVS